MYVQLALEPLWKLYEVCNPGADVKTALGKAAKSLGLAQVTFLLSTTAALADSAKLPIIRTLLKWAGHARFWGRVGSKTVFGCCIAFIYLLSVTSEIAASFGLFYCPKSNASL